MKIAKILLICGLVPALLAGCAKEKFVGLDPNVEITDLASLPIPVNGYVGTILPGDSLDVVVLGSELLTGKYTVDQNGSLNFPLVGQISVGGEVPSVASAQIAQQLSGEYVVNPEVYVTADKQSEATISIGGEINKPGTYAVRQSPTLLRAVNNAGGLTQYAEFKEVLVKREVDGRGYIGVYNIEAIQRGNYQDPQIYSGDVITVGDSPSRRTLETILQYMPLLSSSVILIDRLGR